MQDLIDKAGTPTGRIAALATPAVTYIGTKVLHAVPCNRAEYCRVRGWELPLNEQADDPGYLVQYTDGGLPNQEGFDGYISWSPKDVFENAYTPVATNYIERMQREAEELEEKVTKLRLFIGQVDRFELLQKADQIDLTNQERLMTDYLNVLRVRIKRAKAQQ